MLSNRDKLLCIERELGYRRRVYPRLCASGKMTLADSVREIATMQAIVTDYADLVARDEPKLKLEMPNTTINECLGDGLYASFDGDQVCLVAEREGMTHEVYLDPPTLLAFLEFMKRLRQLRKGIEDQS